MSRIIFLVLITASLFSCKYEETAPDDPEGEWQKVYSDIGEFSVMFPNNAMVIKDTTDYVLEDSLKVRLYAFRQAFFEPNANNVVYQVGVSERPDIKYKEQLEQYFENKKVQMISEMPAKLISELDVDDKGHMGKRFVFETQLEGRQTQIISYHIYNRNKMYAFEVFTYSRLQDPQNAAIDKFFASIDLSL